MNCADNSFLCLKNEDGFALLTTMLFLVILTLIGIAATNTATIEIMIAGGEKNRQKVFYAAEAGIEHCTAILMAPFHKNFAINPSSDWDFALLDVDPGVESFDFIGDSSNLKESFIWIKDKTIGNACTYTVMVRDNDDGDSDIFKDNDTFIYLTSIATATDGSTAGVEILLQGILTPGTATGYTGQAGAGAGKSFRADDVKSITVFTPQTNITP